MAKDKAGRSFSPLPLLLFCWPPLSVNGEVRSVRRRLEHGDDHPTVRLPVRRRQSEQSANSGDERGEESHSIGRRSAPSEVGGRRSRSVGSRSPQMSRQFWSPSAEGTLKDFVSLRWHPSGMMMLCNCILYAGLGPSDAIIVIGFVAGGIRQGISAPVFVVAGAALHCYVCDFLLLLCVPFVLLRRFPSRSSVRPTATASQSNCRRR